MENADKKFSDGAWYLSQNEKNICEYIERLRKKKGMKRVGACYKKIGSPCLCFIHIEVTFLAVTVIAEWP